MGGDDFNKTDESDGVLPFAPVAKKQTQMNAEHASWLLENHILESNIELFESVSKVITKAASQGHEAVDLHFTRSIQSGIMRQLIEVLKRNGFIVQERELLDWINQDRLENIFGNWTPQNDGRISLVKIYIQW